jgi:rhodanese-related sulfurtransferase
MSREIDVQRFAAAHADGALVLDVREPHEYVAGHVPGARLLPLGTVSARAGDLPTDRQVFVICASGNRSCTAAGLLAAAGVDAVSVIGGTNAWSRSGRPVVRGPHEDGVAR